MRVLMLTCNNSLMDGINRHILTVAGALNRREDVEVAVCSTFAQGELHEALAKVGVKTFALDCPNGHAFPILWRFWRVMRAFKPDVVHGHVTSLFVGLVLRFCFGKVKYVTTTHGIADSIKRQDKLSAFLSPRVDFHCYISKGVRDALRGSVKKSEIVYNPIDCVGKVIPKEPHPMTIGTACRIADVKQPLVFTEVMIRVLKQMPECKAVVCGDDAGNGYLDKMRKMISDAGVEGRFQLLGYRPDAPELMRNMNCFVLTSQREGMPTALLEAMCADVPVAFMKGEGGLIDLAEMNNSESPYAIVVDKDDVSGMVAQICQLLSNDEMAKRLIRNSREVLREYFSADSVAVQLCEIYGSLMRDQAS